MSLEHVPGDTWTILEEDIDKEKLTFWETIFTLGNGFLCSRGILEEGYEDEHAGTYFAGTYDKGECPSFGIVNAPNPLPFEIEINGTKLCAEQMEVIEHRRSLDMKKGILTRRTVFRAHDGNRYEYESLRFFSLANMHLGAMRINFRSKDADADVVFRAHISGRTKNGVLSNEGVTEHYSVTDTGKEKELLYLLTRTNDLGIVMGFATSIDVSANGRAIDGLRTTDYVNNDTCTHEASFRAQKGKKYQADKLISTFTSRVTDTTDLKNICINTLKDARTQGITTIRRQHIMAWERVWKNSDIEIEGDETAQKLIRFNMYHLLITAPFKEIDASIGAKALSGEGYRGHVFWDTEIYILPFFIYTHPAVAKNLLMYRYRRLDTARMNAKKLGYLGSSWPWESAFSGEDETPDAWVNFDGSIIPVYTKERELHITADVAYGVFHYYQASGDEEFMLSYGAEIIFEAARFWTSRVSYNEALDRFEIKRVMGPNEFQECIDNNSYTNMLVRWTLKYAHELYHQLRESHPRRLKAVIEKVKLKSEEVDTWKRVYEKIVLLIDSNGLIEEFEGYFNRRDVTISEWDENDMPLWPTGVDLAEIKATQLVKQADVVLLLHLFPDQFSLDTKKINFDYYEKRTTHRSSLSLTSYAILLSELGNIERAYKYFMLTANTDLKDIYHNTGQGIHAAALGGTWQILINGFAGVEIKNGVLSIYPAMPKHWQELKFKIQFRGRLIEFTISKDEVAVHMTHGAKGVDMDICGERYLLLPQKKIVVKKEEPY